MFPWFYFCIALAHTIALIVWIRRWRKNRIQANLFGQKEQHAYCASCGYDLTGRDVNRLEEIEVADCPECGRAIRAKGDAVIPKHINKQLSNKTFALMVGMQVLVVLMMTWNFAMRLQKPPTTRIPTATLLNQAIAFNQAQQNNQAMYELDYRLRNGKLSQVERQKLITDALAYQADPTKPWQWTFGEWIEQGRADGLVTDQQWQRYTAQSGLFQLELREHLYVGDPLVLRVDTDTTKLRTSLDYQFDVYGSLRDEDASLSLYPDTNKKDAKPILIRQVRLGTHWPDWFVPMVDGDTPLPAGRYQIVVDGAFDWPDPNSTRSAISQPVQLAGSIEIYSDTHPLLVPIHDPVLADQIKKTVYQEILQSGGTKVRETGWGTLLSIDLKNPPSPIAGSFDVSVDINGFSDSSTWSYEQTQVSNSWNELTFLIPSHVIQNASDPDKPFDSFSLRFTPNPEHLKRLPKGYKYLDHILWIEDIPLGLPEP